jgi:hypothetical protein
MQAVHPARQNLEINIISIAIMAMLSTMLILKINDELSHAVHYEDLFTNIEKMASNNINLKLSKMKIGDHPQYFINVTSNDQILFYIIQRDYIENNNYAYKMFDPKKIIKFTETQIEAATLAEFSVNHYHAKFRFYDVDYVTNQIIIRETLTYNVTTNNISMSRFYLIFDYDDHHSMSATINSPFNFQSVQLSDYYKKYITNYKFIDNNLQIININASIAVRYQIMFGTIILVNRVAQI